MLSSAVICYLKTENTQGSLGEENQCHNHVRHGPIPHIWEFKGTLLYFRKALHPITYKVIVAKLRVKIIITLWSIQYAFSNSTLKHKLQMFFKAHLRKKFFLCFFKKTCVKLSMLTSKCFAEQGIRDISLFFRPKHKYFTNGENKEKYLLGAKKPVASRLGRD